MAEPVKKQAAPSKPEPVAVGWEDPLDLENQLTEEERMIRDSARAFAQDKLMPRVLQAFRDERIRPRDHGRARGGRLPRRDDRRGIRRRRRSAMSPMA